MRLAKTPNPQKKAKDAGIYSARLELHLTLSRTLVTFTLYTNSVFIAAPPCHGTHRVDPHLAEKYTFEVRKLEDLETVSREGDSSTNIAILVITATGGPAKEVFARTWCCHTGTNSVIWKREGDCRFVCTDCCIHRGTSDWCADFDMTPSRIFANLLYDILWMN